MSAASRSKLRVFFDISKKLIDIFDDVSYLLWNSIRNVFSEATYILLNSVTTAVIAAIILFAESYQGIKDAASAYLEKPNQQNQRKTRIATGLFIFISGTIGFSLSVALFIGVFGVSVLGFAILPGIIPAILALIYKAELGKMSYILHQTKKNPKSKEALYEAERNVAFKTLEVVATSLVLVGTILSLVIFANIVSFGVASLALLIAGISLGFLVKLGEYIDDKKKHAPTKFMREKIVGTYKRLMPSFETALRASSGRSAAPMHSPVRPEEARSAVSKDKDKSTKEAVTSPTPSRRGF